LQENNTKGLVEVMKTATEEFNKQMSDLINKLVQENFAQLNESVENLNSWQKENIENISALTSHFKETTELFAHSSLVLKEVAENTKQLVSDDGKLKEIIQQLSTVLIDDDKFVSITSKLSNTIDLVEKSTILYEETSSKLNQWVVNEYEFKQGVEILITKLEEFKDFNGELWISYRKEMQEAVNIIKDTTSAFNDNVDNLNAEFYVRLSNTLENLDSYIVTLIERERDE
jgi:predicted metal-dependent hydrolase